MARKSSFESGCGQPLPPLENGQMLMDYDVELHPGDESVTFGDMKDGGLYVRVAGTMKVAAHRKAGGGKLAGTILNSRGQRNTAAWGKQAEWCDYFGPNAKGKTVGIAMFDHPDNLRFPTQWHARDYGLNAANRFGERSFQSSNEKAGRNLPAARTAINARLAMHAAATTRSRRAKA